MLPKAMPRLKSLFPLHILNIQVHNLPIPLSHFLKAKFHTLKELVNKHLPHQYNQPCLQASLFLQSKKCPEVLKTIIISNSSRQVNIRVMHSLLEATLRQQCLSPLIAHRIIQTHHHRQITMEIMLIIRSLRVAERQ